MLNFKTILFACCIIACKVSSQEKLYDEDKNHIQNKEVLTQFLNKLQNEKSATILHLGDSHIQANFFTGHLRELFKNQFGESSRGITFPLRLAKTHGHTDIKYYSDIEWESSKIIDPNNTKVGVCGASINTSKPSFYIKIANKENLTINNVKIIGKGLKKLKIGIPNTLIQEPSPSYLSKTYKVKKGDYLIKIAKKFKTSVASLRKWNHLKNDRININQKLKIRKKGHYKPVTLNLNNFNLITPTSQTDEELTFDTANTFDNLYIISNEKETSYTKIDGIFINNNNTGVTYHSIGINGAKYTDYLKSDLFFNQLQHIKPDLVIVSLGTNGGVDKNYKTDNFYTDAENLIEKIKSHTLCKSILITTPPSSLLKRKHTNPKLNTFSEALLNLSNKNDYALWNLNEIMGSTNIKYWHSKNLATKDLIHYTKNGYILQAELLFKSLLND